MICPKCSSEIRPGAKFCSGCGEKVEQSYNCPKCGNKLRIDAKFCGECGHRLVVASDSTKAPDIKTSKGRILWNIQPGQVARVINELEFESYNDIKGIIVPEGTTAYIRANGKTIASITGGTYDFKSTFSFGEVLKKGWQFLVRLYNSFNDKLPEAPTQEQIHRYQQQAILDNAKENASFSVIILLNKAFPLTIGAKHENLDDYKNFVPLEIQTRHIKMGVGIRAYFQISDPEEFIKHYLLDKNVLNSALMAHELSDIFRVIIQDTLYDVELQSNRIPAELLGTIKENINAKATENLFGISVARIVEISAENESLEKFAQWSESLYISEKELDFTKRTYDFINRLSDAENDQKIKEASSDLELQKQLNIINRGKNNEELLNEDELAKFEHLLRNERIVREAKSDNERDLALKEVAKSDLISSSDLALLDAKLSTELEENFSALKLLELKNEIEFERVRLEGDTNAAKLIVERKLAERELEDKLFYKELDRQKAYANAEIDIEKRRRELDREDDDAQFQQFLKMQQVSEQAEENKRKHEYEMQNRRLQSQEELERMKWENAQKLSEESVWALTGGEGAVAYAQNKYNADREREMAERMEAQHKAHEQRMDAANAAHHAESRETRDRMFEMMNNMIAMTGNIQAQRIDEQRARTSQQMEDKERKIQEQEDRIRRQEGRMDNAYDRALNYTTREHVQSKVECPECGCKLDAGTTFCDNCGFKLK